jgi:carboxyl-terminal processing protease
MNLLLIHPFRLPRPSKPLRLCGLMVFLSIWPACAHSPKAQNNVQNIQLETFEAAWSRIGETYYDPEMNGLDWVSLHDQLVGEAAKAQNNSELRLVLKQLLEPLGESHFAILPSEIYSEPAQTEQIASTEQDGLSFHGSLGLKISFKDGQAIVREVDPKSDAYAQGLRVGSRLVSINNVNIRARLDQLQKEITDERALEFHGTRMINGLLEVASQSTTPLELESPEGGVAHLDLKPHAIEGTSHKMGMLPEFLTVYESKMIANNAVGFVRFTEWAPPIVERFTESVAEFNAAGATKGLIIDLRENPGGVAALSMGVAGHLVKKRGQSLGVMQDKTVTLNLKIFPRPRSQRWEGPVVILMDGLSASTSEIFAAGLQDLNEATIIGSQSAGMALASMIEILPNGDRLQFVIWNLTRTNGERVEGAGVTPNIVVHSTPASFQNGQDPVIEAALDFLLAE